MEHPIYTTLRDTSKNPPLVIAARHTILRENGDLWSTFAAVHSLIFFLN